MRLDKLCVSTKTKWYSRFLFLNTKKLGYVKCCLNSLKFSD